MVRIVEENRNESIGEEAVVTRRSSARIKSLEIKKADVNLRKREEAVAMKAERPVKRKKVECGSPRGKDVSLVTEKVEGGLSEGVVEGEVKGEEDVVMVESGTDRVGPVVEKSTATSVYARVRDTIRNFYKYYLFFVQEEEQRCKKDDDEKTKPKKPRAYVKKEEKMVDQEEDADNKKSKKSKAKNKDGEKEKQKAKRPDLKSLNKMQKSNLTLIPPKRIGSIPGVDVGHQFFSRCEMVTVGFHNHWLCGIDYIGVSKQKEYPEYVLPITVAIVMSGQYEDDLDNSEDVVYTGQGGNDLLGNKRQISDQEMTRGNLGLKNSMDQNVPVRVIRGHESRSSYVGKVYTYDGLYRVDKYWAEKGRSGFTVYKFSLKRIAGQPHLITEQVYFSRGRIPNSIAELQGMVSEDISGGLERIPIPATNTVDDPPVPPTGLTYIRSLQFARNVVQPPSASGCNCKGSCSDPRSCGCARLNGSDFPYVHRDGGRLIEPKAVVFECGPNCGCGPSCVNRTSQRDMRYRLEVYKTPNKGWAVRSWDFIPSGAPVCEYIGVVRRTDDIDLTADNMYIFDMDCLQTMNGLGVREKRVGEVNMAGLLEKYAGNVGGPEFCIDAGTTGNVTRYINHSCQPNLFVQSVVSAHHELTQARVVLFAADNIQPLKELTYDYGYELGSVSDGEGNVRQLACLCGAPECRKRMF